MMVALTQYQKNALARRKTSDITRLTDAYQKNMAAATQEYETSFSDYTTKRDALMAPYNKAMDQYKTDFAAYEQSNAGYKQRLADYQAKLEAYNASPYETVTPTYNSKALTKINGQVYQGDFYVKGMQINDYLASVGSPTRVTMGNYRNEGLEYGKPFQYMKKGPGTFTEKAPVAPTAPTQPDIPEFDSSQFEQKKAALETDFKREVGERKAGRLNAVSRSGARPMLQGK